MNPKPRPGFKGANAASEHEQLIDRLLDDPAKQEALQWLKTGEEGERRTIGHFKSAEESIQFVQQIYELGASNVFAVQIRLVPKTTGRRTGKLVVELPKDVGTRQAIFDWCKVQGDSLGFSPNLDHGENHLFLLLD